MEPLSRKQWTWLALGAATIFALVYLTPPDLFGTIDWVRIHVFYKNYARDAVLGGRLPLWNPYVSLGRPFLADVDAATLFYPPGLPYLVLPPEIACALVGALHLALAGYGALRLCAALRVERSLAWLAALAFVLSAPIVGSFHSGLIHYGPALCWLPLVLALALELQEHTPSLRRVLGLGLVLGLQLLAGHPQAAWLTWLGAGVVLLARRPRLRDVFALTGSVTIALLLAAIMLLPLWELTGQSNRGAPSIELASAYAMPSFGWASLLVPSDPQFSFLANAQLYCGIAPLIAALVATMRWRDRDVRALLVLAVGAALLAAGSATPLFRVLYVLVPGVSSLRLHSRASVLVSTALIALALVTLARTSEAERPRAVRWTLVAGALVTLAQIAFVVGWPGFAGDRVVRVVVRVSISLASIATLVFWLRNRSRVALLSLAIVLCADLGWGVVGLKPQNRDEGDRPTEAALANALREQGALALGAAPPRVSMPRPYARENAGMQYGWSSFTGYAALSLDRVWYHVHTMLGLVVPTQQNTYVDRRVFQQRAFPFDSMSLLVGMDPQTREVLSRTPDPRAYVVTAALRVRDHHEATARMREGHDFHSIALVEDALGLPSTPVSTPLSTGTARIVSFAPERVVVRVDTTRESLLVLGEAYYPGWTATVNTSPRPVVPVNAWMRGVRVPVGASEVIFTFHSRYLALGATISLATLLALLLALRATRRS